MQHKIWIQVVQIPKQKVHSQVYNFMKPLDCWSLFWTSLIWFSLCESVYREARSPWCDKFVTFQNSLVHFRYGGDCLIDSNICCNVQFNFSSTQIILNIENCHIVSEFLNKKENLIHKNFWSACPCLLGCKCRCKPTNLWVTWRWF